MIDEERSAPAAPAPLEEGEMSRIRVLVGTRKGAFVLTADGKRDRWDVSGPHFGGWEIYHLKGSPADPNRIYVSQSSGWFGQLIQRSDDGGRTWEDLRDGLPQSNAFFGVLRQAMATDRHAPAGVYFGTSSGSVFASADEGESWSVVAEHLPAIHSVETLVIDR